MDVAKRKERDIYIKCGRERQRDVKRKMIHV